MEEENRLPTNLSLYTIPKRRQNIEQKYDQYIHPITHKKGHFTVSRKDTFFLLKTLWCKFSFVQKRKKNLSTEYNFYLRFDLT